MRLGIIAAIVFVLSACSGSRDDANSPQRRDSAASGHSPRRDTAAVVQNDSDCVALHSATSGKCGNLLPAGWRDMNEVQLSALHVQLDSLEKRSWEALATAERESSEGCRDSSNKKDKPLEILLRAPFAMDSFPRLGTAGNDLVTTIFVVKKDKNCREARYSVQRERDRFRKSIEFQTVSTKAAGESDTIGQWTTWSLSWRKNGERRYRLDSLRAGSYVRCAKEHPETKGNVAFISCDDAVALARAAEKSATPEAEFTSLLGAYMRREPRILAVTRGDPFSDTAWGRCGSMGCCASEF